MEPKRLTMAVTPSKLEREFERETAELLSDAPTNDEQQMDLLEDSFVMMMEPEDDSWTWCDPVLGVDTYPLPALPATGKIDMPPPKQIANVTTATDPATPLAMSTQPETPVMKLVMPLLKGPQCGVRDDGYCFSTAPEPIQTVDPYVCISMAQCPCWQKHGDSFWWDQARANPNQILECRLCESVCRTFDGIFSSVQSSEQPRALLQEVEIVGQTGGGSYVELLIDCMQTTLTDPNPVPVLRESGSRTKSTLCVPERLRAWAGKQLSIAAHGFEKLHAEEARAPVSEAGSDALATKVSNELLLFGKSSSAGEKKLRSQVVDSAKLVGLIDDPDPNVAAAARRVLCVCDKFCVQGCTRLLSDKMLACDICSVWFHCGCVRVSEAKARSDAFICKRCMDAGFMTNLRPSEQDAPPRRAVNCEPIKCHSHARILPFPTTLDSRASPVPSSSGSTALGREVASTASVNDDDEFESDQENSNGSSKASSSKASSSKASSSNGSEHGVVLSAAEKARRQGAILNGKYIIDPDVKINTSGGQGEIVVVIDGAGGKRSLLNTQPSAV